jgi:hypothetical protein
MAVKPGNKKEIAVKAGRSTPMFRVVRGIGAANRTTGRLRRGNP